MKRLTMTLVGKSPILFHNGAAMAPATTKKLKDAIPAPADEARRSLYLCEDGSIGFPITNCIQAMIRASFNVKDAKVKITSYLAGAVTPAQEMASFGVKDYEIDIRRVVIQRNGVLRARAKLTSWMLPISLMIDDESLPSDRTLALIPELFADAGLRIGIGDYRPEKRGPYGRFVVTNVVWK